VTAEQLVLLRAALAEAKSAGERLPILADLVELAAELDPADGNAATSVAAALDEALPWLRAPASSPADDEDYPLTLYLIARACLLRDRGPDLDDAIACLRELRDGLLADPPADLDESPEEIQDPEAIMTEIQLRLGLALGERASRRGASAADVDEASAALAAGLAGLASDAAERPALTLTLALQYAARYVGYRGTQDHRMAALALAAEVLAAPGAAPGAVAGAHLVLGWMTLARQMTSDQRSGMLMQPEMEAARRGEPGATAMITAMGEVQIDLAAAETGLSHLRQIPDEAGLDADLTVIAAGLSGLALLAIIRAGQVSEDIDRVAGQLQNTARQFPPDQPGHGELLAVRAALLAARAASEGYQDQLRPAAEALGAAAARLPEGHLIRSGLLDQLLQSVSQQVDRATSADDVAAEAEQIMDMLERMPRDDPQFARTLTMAAVRLLTARLLLQAAVPLDRVIIQLDRTVKRLAPDDPMKLIGEAMYWGAIAAKAALEYRPELVQSAVSGLNRCGDQMPADSAFRSLPFLFAGAALIERYSMTGELRPLDQAQECIDKATKADEEAAAPASGMQPVASLLRVTLIHLRSLLRLARVQHEPEGEDLTETVADLEQAVGLMKPEDPFWSRMVALLQTARAMQERLVSGRRSPASLGRSEREAFEQVLAEAKSMSRDHHNFPLVAGQAATGLMLRGLADSDTTAMGEAISLLAEACSVPGLTYRERPRMLNAHGMALLTRYRWSQDPRDLSLAIDRLEEARRAVEQELGSPYAADVLQSLASAYRTRGDPARGDVDRAVAVGLDSLREHAGDVLLQDDDENALRAARLLTSDAGEMARWFLWRGRAGAAIEALEFGRGTVLHAATSGAGLAEVLADAGHAELAAEWAAAMSGGEARNPDAADDLRYRIMLAIEGSAAEARLLAPPSLDDIKAALQASRVDALVYLLPRDDDGPGMAVLVHSAGRVQWIPLPGLQAGPGTPVGSFLQARRAGEENWRAALGELCDWSWRAAIGPVLAAIPARSGGARRVVLVPGGELGLVAWHAARQRVGGSYRYAAQEAVFSYAASARQFVEGTRRQPRPWAQAPVLISDSAASAYAMEVAICHLYTAHYPAASVFGRAHTRLTSSGRPEVPGSAAARSADVLAVLPHEAFPGASVLHFGCHGRAQVPVLASHLSLGGDHTLAVRHILQQARKTSGHVSGGLVVLAACLTDVAETDYDEAVTLATAFLSAGAAGVVAARWKVPTLHTALFMAAFHHYLNTTDRYPAQALRSAQVWMLDPGREPPGPLPTVLRDETARADLADPVAWAGFAYQGW
jgi:hypothetical protein